MIASARAATLAAAVFLAGCATAPAPVRAPARSGPANVLEQPSFQLCEIEAVRVLDVARNAQLLHSSREAMLAIGSNGPAELAMINRVYARVAAHPLENGGDIAAETFYACADRSHLLLRRDPTLASHCLAHQDIVFILDASHRILHLPASDASTRVKLMLGTRSSEIYPEHLIDELTAPSYRIRNDDDFESLRMRVFESCLFPAEWKALHGAENYK